MQTKCDICGTQYDPQVQQHHVPITCVPILAATIGRLEGAINRLHAEIEALGNLRTDDREYAKELVGNLEGRHVRLAERVTKIEQKLKGSK